MRRPEVKEAKPLQFPTELRPPVEIFARYTEVPRMTQRKSFRDRLDSSLLPLILVILIPAAVILYAFFGANDTAAPAQEQGAQQTTTTQSGPQYVSTASVSLDDSSSLATTVPSSQFVPFSFTITNDGSTGGQIPYRVSVKWSTGEQDVIDENVVTLAAGASQSIPEELKFEIATETAEVSLELPQGGQTVQFALPSSR